MARRTSSRRERDIGNRSGQASTSGKPRPCSVPVAGLQRNGVLGLAVLIAALAIGVFLPCLRHGFVNFDDPVYVYENTHALGGLAWPGIQWAFASLEAGFWHPLTWLSIMLDCQVFGLRAGGHHLTSMLLHAATAVLLFLMLRSVTGATWRSSFVAALFAFHPLHVEPVAWAAARKDVLSAFFWMLTLFTYARYARLKLDAAGQAGCGRLFLSILYLLSLVFCIGSLASKTMAVTLPLTLLLLDVWPLRRLQLKAEGPKLKTIRPLVIEKLPFFAAAFACGVLTMHAEAEIGALAATSRVPIPDRVANAFLSYAQYLVQTLWPTNLAVFYPYPKHFSLVAIMWAAALLLTVSILAGRAARRCPWFVFGWSWYGVTLLPVIGFIQVGSHAHADRYTYIPLIGIFVLIAWGAFYLAQSWRYHVPVLASAAVAAIVACGLLSHQQVAYWQNSETLLRHALAATGENAVACNNLGSALVNGGRLDDALHFLREAARINPEDAGIQDNLGTTLARLGRLDEAIPHLREAVRLNPRHAGARNDLGAALGQAGLITQAVEQLQVAVQLAPSDAGARCNLGDALASQGGWDDAVEQYQSALRLSPGYPEAHCNLGLALSQLGRLDEAIAHFQEAIRLKPGFVPAQSALRVAQESKASRVSPPATPPKP